MRDFYPLVARAVSRLENNTPSARQALFEHVRVVLTNQLQIRQPPPSTSEIMRERAALEAAFQKIESTLAASATSRTGSPHTRQTERANGGDRLGAFEQHATRSPAPAASRTGSAHPPDAERVNSGKPLRAFDQRATSRAFDQRATSSPAPAASRTGSEQAFGAGRTNGGNPLHALEQHLTAELRPHSARPISEHQPTREPAATADGLAARTLSTGKHSSGRPRAILESTRGIFADQLPVGDRRVARSEATPSRGVIRPITRPINSHAVSSSETTTASAHPPTPTRPEDTGRQTATTDQPLREVKNHRRAGQPANELTETATASILDNLRGIRLLDRLMLEAAHPFAPDSLKQDATAVLKWLGVAKPEVIQSKHYDHFGRAIRGYMIEGSTPSCRATAAKMPALDPAPTNEICGIFNRLLDQEQSATVFDSALAWFAYVWVRLIIGLNVIVIVGVLLAAPIGLGGIVNLAKIYSPLNACTWIAELVAFLPALGATAWRDRRLKGSWAAAVLTSEFLLPDRLRRQSSIQAAVRKPIAVQNRETAPHDGDATTLALLTI
jgi:hypothetical protein